MIHIDAEAKLFKKDAIDLILKGQVCSLEEEIFHKLIKAKKFLAFPTNSRYYDIGNFEGLKVIKEILR